MQYFATNEVGPRWYVDLLSVTFNPSGDFSPIGDTFAKLPVTGTVQAVDGVFGTMTLKPDAGTVEPENVLQPFITGGTGAAGAPKVGDTMTANIGGWIGASSFAYSWKAGGTAGGAAVKTAKTYIPVTCRFCQDVDGRDHRVQRHRPFGPGTQRSDAGRCAVG